MIHIMKQVSDDVAKALEDGKIPWRLQGLHRNVLNKKAYGGVNQMLLNLEADRLGLQPLYWGTYAQWQLMSKEVRREAEGTRITLYKQLIRSTIEYQLTRDFLYNGEQVIGSFQPPSLPPVNTKKFFEDLIDVAKIKIKAHFSQECYYNRDTDSIRLPYMFMFVYGPGKVEGYWLALGHEIFHWTESRMGWNENDAVNELRADIGSAYLCAALQAKPTQVHLRTHHDKWVKQWISELKADPELLFRVCNDVCNTIIWLMKFVSMEMEWQINQHNVVPHDSGRRTVVVGTPEPGKVSTARV